MISADVMPGILKSTRFKRKLIIAAKIVFAIIIPMNVLYFYGHTHIHWRHQRLNVHQLYPSTVAMHQRYQPSEPMLAPRTPRILNIQSTSIPIGSPEMSHQNIIDSFYKPRNEWLTSNLGTILFKHDNQSRAVARNQRTEIFTILIWKHWPRLKNRHTYGFRKHRNNTLHGCSVTNCIFSGDMTFDSADAVMVHLQRGHLPNVTNRNPLQLWIFWADESPINTFSIAKEKPSYLQLSNIFNWSMTYRFDSDVPIPYGRTIALPYPKLQNVTTEALKELVPYWYDKQSDVLVTILASNCFPPRMQSLMSLQEHINIDVFGRCAINEYGRKMCPGHFHSDCGELKKYFFYIVIENSRCREYITEKTFHSAYDKGAIPVIMGPLVKDCNTLLPPNSFLHIDNFESPQHLAAEIRRISQNVTKLLSYHRWRNHFKVVNEHGYFQTKSAQLCRVCEALNYNERKTKVYSLADIRMFLDPEICC